ncbi:hypothetical protein VKT23_002504 [Stygiomarasmius scandens]|uniref:C3H1-type domain-containing protein n=1 Tax=Marasmiellus scandens TaxID=2682957 RepID=A0ABR1K2M7_9AGAR
MSPRSRNVAQHTLCKKHTMLYSGVPTESMRHHTYSDCEYHGKPCPYSHDIFNIKRVLKLGTGTIHLNYGHGFERYGSHECNSRGWSITLNKMMICFDTQKTQDLPKSVLLAEENRNITRVGAPEVEYEKTQSLCYAHQSGRCTSGSQCRFDHDLIDAKRLEKLVRWGHDSGTCEYLTVECRHDPRGSVRWKITLKADAFMTLKTNDPIAKKLPRRPFSKEGNDLLQVIREMEGIVGIDSPSDASGSGSSNTSDDNKASHQPKSTGANVSKSSAANSSTTKTSGTHSTQPVPAKNSPSGQTTTSTPTRTSARPHPKSTVADVSKPSTTNSSTTQTSGTAHRAQPVLARKSSFGAGLGANQGRLTKVSTYSPPPTKLTGGQFTFPASSTAKVPPIRLDGRGPLANSPPAKKDQWQCYIS